MAANTQVFCQSSWLWEAQSLRLTQIKKGHGGIPLKRSEDTHHRHPRCSISCSHFLEQSAPSLGHSRAAAIPPPGTPCSLVLSRLLWWCWSRSLPQHCLARTRLGSGLSYHSQHQERLQWRNISRHFTTCSANRKIACHAGKVFPSVRVCICYSPIVNRWPVC